jgi:hypothetical protein
MAFELTSSVFTSGGPIPCRHTCEGEDLSPPFHWSVPPPATKSFVIIADDPDSGAFSGCGRAGRFFLSILRAVRLLSQTCGLSKFCRPNGFFASC